VSETILERQVRAPETDTPAPQSFDFDRRAFALRIILCACLGVCSIVISIMAWDVMPTLLLLTIALPLTIVIAWFSGLRLRMAPPIIRLDRDGIWDRRLGIGPVPWRRIRAIELDRNADVVLILADGFRPADNDKHAGSPELFTSGSGYQAGKI
jgi:hypothetical protein